MRKYGKTDSNQRQIVSALRQAGCSVQSLASVGSGCADLLIGKAGQNYLLEVKDSAKPPSARRLTPDEHKWHSNWRGQVCTVTTIDEALEAIDAI